VELKKHEMATMLIEKGARTDLGDSEGRTPLHIAVIAKDSEMIRILIERGTRIKSLDKDGRTPLCHAVRTEDPAIVAALLSGGYNADVKSSYVQSPLEYIMEMPMERESCALSLLNEFLKVREKATDFHSHFHALRRAARKGKVQFVKYMLKNEPELAFRRPAATSGFQPAIHEVVRAGNVAVARELLSPGKYMVDLNVTDHEGNTALHQAILNDQNVLVALLVETGADKELQTGPAEGFLPPLHLAARKQNKMAVKLLLQHGADCKRRIANVPLCEKCRALRPVPSGGNARCILINLEPGLRKPDFHGVDKLLYSAINERG